MKKYIKLFSFIIFFLLVLNIPTNKAQACQSDWDCPTCSGCFLFVCLNAQSDTRCSTMCENGSCAKQCTGACKQSCDTNNGETPGDPFVDGECFENGAISSSLHCCVSGGVTQNCSGECQTNCWPDTQRQDANGTCFNSNKICCVPLEASLDPVDLTEDINIDIDIPQDNEITQLESGTNSTTSVLFEGVNCIDSGNCSVNDIMTVGINITKFLLGIIGSIALFFFVFAGFKMLTSRGNEQAITSAKQMMTQTIIGILIFLSAFLIVDFVRKSLLEESVETGTKIDQNYNKNWANTTN